MKLEDPLPPVVLALDTSTPVLSAAVSRADVVYSRHIEAGRHTGALVPNIVAEVLAEAQCTAVDLTGIAVGVGPGPYTSLRAGVMFAEAAAAALNIPVIGACSLDITARGHRGDGSVGEFVVAADARRRELYWARYDADGERRTGPQVDSRQALEAVWAESGTTVVDSTPSAAALARWVVDECQRHGGVPVLAATTQQWVAPSNDAAGLDIPQALLIPRPLYLRRPDAVEPATVPGLQGSAP